MNKVTPNDGSEGDKVSLHDCVTLSSCEKCAMKLELRAVCRHSKAAGRYRALQDITLSVAPGELCACWGHRHAASPRWLKASSPGWSSRILAKC